MTSITDSNVINAPGGLIELGYGTTTTAITVSATSSAYASATTIISDITVVCDGSPTFLEFYTPSIATSATSGDYIIICLYRDASLLTLWGQSQTPAGGIDQKPLTLTYRDSPTAGTHTYAVKAYRITANGTVGLANASGWSPTFLRICKIVQASQWPAVTTGTIICTSTTRPSSPFEGQQIYEADTKKTLTYNGSGWYQFNQLVAVATSSSSFSAASAYTTYQDIGLSATVSYAANRKYKVTLHHRPYVNGGSNTLGYRLTDGSTVFVLFPYGTNDLSTSTAPVRTNSYIFSGPTTNGSATWKIQGAATLNNTAWIDYYGADGSPRQLTIEDVGPA